MFLTLGSQVTSLDPPHWASKNEKLVAQQDNLPVMND